MISSENILDNSSLNPQIIQHKRIIELLLHYKDDIQSLSQLNAYVLQHFKNKKRISQNKNQPKFEGELSDFKDKYIQKINKDSQYQEIIDSDQYKNFFDPQKNRLPYVIYRIKNAKNKQNNQFNLNSSKKKSKNDQIQSPFNTKNVRKRLNFNQNPSNQKKLQKKSSEQNFDMYYFNDPDDYVPPFQKCAIKQIFGQSEQKDFKKRQERKNLKLKKLDLQNVNHNVNENINTSQFKISQLQKPMTHYYQIKLISNDYTKKQFKQLLKKYGLIEVYRGQVRFQQYVQYQYARFKVLSDILEKNKTLKIYLSDHNKQLKFLQSDEPFILQFVRNSQIYNSCCFGKILLPLNLKLQQGLYYHYERYNGKLVKGLVIFNQYAQICMLQNINFGYDPQTRNLINKIVIKKEGVNIRASYLDKKICRVSLFRPLKIFLNTQQYRQQQIIPLELDERYLQFQQRKKYSIEQLKRNLNLNNKQDFSQGFDSTKPYRLVRYIKDWKTQIWENKQKQKHLSYKINTILNKYIVEPYNRLIQILNQRQ